jgi:hypothetical protein
MTTIEIRALECNRPHQRLDRSKDRRSGLQWTLTRLTVQMGATEFVLIVMVNHRLGHACGERLAQPPNRLTHLGSGQLGVGQLAFHLIEPLVKAFVKLLA